ncbi:PIN domain-containing protein [Candidatus Woesearchaeota archaeon]|nr:PIN domain-containing protein [Candidatus Woesearchaeota archaeon]
MPKKYYLDTSIWRDYFEGRSNGLRPLGEWAWKLINLIIKDKNIFLYSDIVVQELKKYYPIENINKTFAVARVEGLLEKVYINPSQEKEAYKLSKNRKVSFHDALHAIIARDEKAVLVARDKHFLKLLDIIVPKKPEEII